MSSSLGGPATLEQRHGSSLLRLGTRGSKLALTQAGLVRDALAAAVPALAAPDAIEIVAIKTTGDAIQDRPLSEAGGKGLFVKEIEEAMLAAPHRHRRAQHEGHADGAARRAA